MKILRGGEGESTSPAGGEGREGLPGRITPPLYPRVPLQDTHVRHNPGGTFVALQPCSVCQIALPRLHRRTKWAAQGPREAAASRPPPPAVTRRSKKLPLTTLFRPGDLVGSLSLGCDASQAIDVSRGCAGAPRAFELLVAAGLCNRAFRSIIDQLAAWSAQIHGSTKEIKH